MPFPFHMLVLLFSLVFFVCCASKLMLILTYFSLFSAYDLLLYSSFVYHVHHALDSLLLDRKTNTRVAYRKHPTHAPASMAVT